MSDPAVGPWTKFKDAPANIDPWKEFRITPTVRPTPQPGYQLDESGNFSTLGEKNPFSKFKTAPRPKWETDLDPYTEFSTIIRQPTNPFDQFDNKSGALMGSSSFASWILVAVLLCANVWVTHQLLRSLSKGQRSNRREGVVRVFAVLIFLTQAYAIWQLASAASDRFAFERAGFAVTAVPLAYCVGLIFVWIIDGFTGRGKSRA